MGQTENTSHTIPTTPRPACVLRAQTDHPLTSPVLSHLTHELGGGGRRARGCGHVGVGTVPSVATQPQAQDRWSEPPGAPGRLGEVLLSVRPRKQAELTFRVCPKTASPGARRGGPAGHGWAGHGASPLSGTRLWLELS